MPDIKTALEKALSQTATAWAADDEAHLKIAPKIEQPVPETKHYFTTINNVCRATFEFILKNPGKTRKEIIEVLFEGGYKKTSTSSLIGQMIKQNQIRESNGLLYTIKTEYAPIKNAKSWAKLQDKQQAAPRKHVEITSKATGKVFNPRPAPAPAPVEKEWTPDDVIAKLNVHQALALFKALRNIFVG